MAEAHRRKKNPEQVRRDIIDSAQCLALEQGLVGVSLDAVAKNAGVTKGGLFHHFANKQVLIDAVFQTMLSEFEAALDARMAADPEPYGRFTRAWIGQSLEAADVQWAPLWMASLTDARLRQLWGDWFAAKLAASNEDDFELELARFTADGIWLGVFFGTAPADREALRVRLIAMTRKG